MVNNINYGKEIHNGLTNGFVWSIPDGIDIGPAYPDETLNWVLQTGPLVIDNNRVVKLAIKDDNFARRSVAAINSSGNPIILEITLADQINSGPLLDDLPAIISLINTKENLHLIRAVNLDGGGASVFVTKNTDIKELEPVGSFICIK